MFFYCDSTISIHHGIKPALSTWVKQGWQWGSIDVQLSYSQAFLGAFPLSTRMADRLYYRIAPSSAIVFPAQYTLISTDPQRPALTRKNEIQFVFYSFIFVKMKIPKYNRGIV